MSVSVPTAATVSLHVGAVVDWDALVEMLWTSTAAALGVTAAFAIAIHGATRAADMRREGRLIESAVFAGSAALGLAVVAAAVVFGIVVMVGA